MTSKNLFNNYYFNGLIRSAYLSPFSYSTPSAFHLYYSPEYESITGDVKTNLNRFLHNLIFFINSDSSEEDVEVFTEFEIEDEEDKKSHPEQGLEERIEEN